MSSVVERGDSSRRDSSRRASSREDSSARASSGGSKGVSKGALPRNSPANSFASPFAPLLTELDKGIEAANPVHATGRVGEVIGTLVKAHVPNVRIGEICELRTRSGDKLCEAEVVGFLSDAALLTLYGDMQSVSTQTDVIPTGRTQEVKVGPGLLGRVLNGMGELMDEAQKGGLSLPDRQSIYADAPNPLTRRIIDQPFSTSIRSIDSLLTCGEGQRLGIFAAAGVGKSTLLSSLVKGAVADVSVIALIGERGREVREFIEQSLGEEGMRKSVLVIATSDKSSMERARAAYVATAVAEYFRARDNKVLFMMDSVTRFARALREIGLAMGEPPTRRGFPPSVFAALPKMMERTGMGAIGSITAFYTVLVEGDDMTEPVADETRSILDGHIVLSRDLAAQNHYPAIDVLESVSRVQTSVASAPHLAAAQRMRKLLSAYNQAELLIKIGEYQAGGDRTTDEAVEKIDSLRVFLQQGVGEFSSFDDTLARLQELVGEDEQH